MYEVLLVDDEFHAIQGVQLGVDWGKYDIHAVHSAYNIRQAKEIIEKNQVDFMICDIEMPEGSGIELLQWVREHYPEKESVFLTCHSDFAFAQQAVQLGCLDYLLKPVRYSVLEAVIGKALGKLEKKRRQDVFNATYDHYYKLWKTHHPLIIERLDELEESRSIVDKVKQYIAANIDQALSRKDMAQHVYLNQDYLAKLFKKKTGIALSDYVVQERMKLAKMLLSGTRSSIGEVAGSVGYSNFSYFTKTFKNEFGMTPQEFRASL
ncbi:response regulator [Paenibacillus alkaliterrae]|uniref:response regulator transcription factor n=1 Tax=Paenibacillus alkaliterrae TaxID=320909 RepID=UPI001F1AF5AD|nr:response regulator [Paenibacillus alkaliterrae]MCF2939262.1 response regulator [Paenibacillus alkaliterrae]